MHPSRRNQGSPYTSRRGRKNSMSDACPQPLALPPRQPVDGAEDDVNGGGVPGGDGGFVPAGSSTG